jgi:hypothetical protein
VGREALLARLVAHLVGLGPECLQALSIRISRLFSISTVGSRVLTFVAIEARLAYLRENPVMQSKTNKLLWVDDSIARGRETCSHLQEHQLLYSSQRMPREIRWLALAWLIRIAVLLCAIAMYSTLHQRIRAPLLSPQISYDLSAIPGPVGSAAPICPRNTES